MSVVADLHVHTTVSDGELAPESVPERARAAGLDAVAVTDHDRLQPGLGAPVVEREGVTVVHGVELRVETDAQRVDLLGYGASPTDGLTAELDRLQRDRVDRAARMVAAVEDRLGVDLDVALEPGVGRPHVARAVADAHPDYDVARAFADLIGDDGPCFVARDVTPVARGVELLADACDLVALAHPLRYPDPGAAIALVAEHGLGGVERYYPYEGAVDQGPVERALRETGALPTGGSDAHGDRLGLAGLGADDWARVAPRLASPVS